MTKPVPWANPFAQSLSQIITCASCSSLSHPSLHAQPTLCALCGPAGAPVCYFSALPPVLTYPLRYPIASPAAKHLLLGENLLLGNRFLKQQLWLCYSLNFTSPAWNNEPVWSGVHLCTCDSLGNDWPLPTRMWLPFSSLLLTAQNAGRFNIEGYFKKLLIVVFHWEGSPWGTYFPIKTTHSCNNLL